MAHAAIISRPCLLDSRAPHLDNRRMSTSQELPEGHRSGFVALAGRPNVGKSTLVNALLGQPIAAVSPRPQTTQFEQSAILTLPQAQIILADTPGIHQPHHKLGEILDQGTARPIRQADVVLALFDLSQPPTDDDRRVAERLAQLAQPGTTVVGLNKVDLVATHALEGQRQVFSDLLPGAAHRILLSATSGQGLDELLEILMGLLPEGPRWYPEAEVTNRYERDLAADLIRAAALDLLQDEVPHSIAVRIDEYTERGEDGAYIQATLFVERESQKGIIVGKGGAMIRQLGTAARRRIEAMSDRKVYLDLRVKVEPGWRNSEAALKRFGYLPSGDR